MTGGLVSLRRISALSVAVSLFAAPIASAQSPDVAPSLAAPANTALLSSVAFARLVQPALAEAAPASVVTNSPRSSLLRQATAMARDARATAAMAPQQKNWASRHKVALIVWPVIVVLASMFGYWVHGEAQ